MQRPVGWPAGRGFHFGCLSVWPWRLLPSTRWGVRSACPPARRAAMQMEASKAAAQMCGGTRGCDAGGSTGGSDVGDGIGDCDMNSGTGSGNAYGGG